MKFNIHIPNGLSVDLMAFGLMLSTILTVVNRSFGPKELSIVSAFLFCAFSWRMVFPAEIGSKTYWASVGLIAAVILTISLSLFIAAP